MVSPTTGLHFMVFKTSGFHTVYPLFKLPLTAITLHAGSKGSYFHIFWLKLNIFNSDTLCIKCSVSMILSEMAPQK